MYNAPLSWIGLTCRMWTSSIQSSSRMKQLPKYPRNLCDVCVPISSCVNECRCRKEHLKKVCNCTFYSTQTQKHWIVLVCILSVSICINHHTKETSMCAHMNTNRKFSLCGDRCESGRYLHTLALKVVYICLPRKDESHQARQALILENQ